MCQEENYRSHTVKIWDSVAYSTRHVTKAATPFHSIQHQGNVFFAAPSVTPFAPNMLHDMKTFCRLRGNNMTLPLFQRRSVRLVTASNVVDPLTFCIYCTKGTLRVWVPHCTFRTFRRFCSFCGRHLVIPTFFCCP